MKKIFFILLIISLSIFSFAQTYDIYAINRNRDNSLDSFLLKRGTDSLFNTSFQYVQRSKHFFDQYYRPVYPGSFQYFFKCADNIFRNRIDPYPIINVTIHADANESLTLTNQQNTEQPLANSQRSAVKINTTGYAEYRLNAIVMISSASANSPRIYLQYSTDGTTWIGGGSGVSLSTTGAKETAWLSLPQGAIGDVYVRVTQNGGDGTADPQLSSVHIQFR
jgi:hypothetical protein